MKTIIENKIKERNKYLKRYHKSWNKEKCEYEMEEPKEIDELGDEIYKILSHHHQDLPVDFVIESLTHLGCDPSILYDDNGNFAISQGGMSSISLKPSDCNLHFFVEKKYWKPTIRKAIEVYFNSLD